MSVETVAITPGVLASLIEYAERFALLADEPEGGDCRRTIEAASVIANAHRARSLSLAEIRNGTGFARRARFVQVEG